MIEKRFYFYGFSLALSILAVIFYFIFPPNLGIDLIGGQMLEIQTKFNRIKNYLKIEGEVIVSSESVIIKGKNVNQENILNEIRKYDPSAKIVRYEEISPTLSRELVRKSFWAIILVLIGIGSYITFVFSEKKGLIKSWILGLIVILTLFHDVLTSFGIYLILSKFYQFELTISIIVAFLLIAGFSVHDTIVVFDRLRENVKKEGILNKEIFEKSIKETIARSINTSLTSILVIIPLIFFIEILKPFVFTLIIGFIIGTYSSICLATPLAYDLLVKIKQS
ncbi:MAG: protein translocase subunit SecF [Patescibacteria group bacterium]|nr:protein translocase subunit SecF [Patescibacteria group bacterium]